MLRYEDDDEEDNDTAPEGEVSLHVVMIAFFFGVGDYSRQLSLKVLLIFHTSLTSSNNVHLVETTTLPTGGQA